MLAPHVFSKVFLPPSWHDASSSPNFPINLTTLYCQETHGSIPNDGLRLANRLGVQINRSWTAIQTHKAICDAIGLGNSFLDLTILRLLQSWRCSCWMLKDVTIWGWGWKVIVRGFFWCLMVHVANDAIINQDQTTWRHGLPELGGAREVHRQNDLDLNRLSGFQWWSLDTFVDTEHCTASTLENRIDSCLSRTIPSENPHMGGVPCTYWSYSYLYFPRSVPNKASALVIVLSCWQWTPSFSAFAKISGTILAPSSS